MVEAAIVFPLLLVVIMGIVEFGLAFKDDLSVGHAAREGARAGATFGRDHYANIQVLREIEGVMAPLGVANGLRVEIYNPVTNNGDLYTFQEGYGGGCNWFPCPDPDRPLVYTIPAWDPALRDVSAPFTDRIAVRVEYTHKWLTGLFRDTSDLTNDVDFQIEPQTFDP